MEVYEDRKTILNCMPNSTASIYSTQFVAPGMRERTTRSLRRGPRYPLPVDATDSTYYSIDSTDDIYGTNLLPSQRCYVDPWDLENYDYVRKKVDSTPQSTLYYDSSMSPSPAGEPVPTQYYYMPKPREAECIDCFAKMGDRALFKTVKYDEYPDEEDPRIYNTYGDFGSSSPSSDRNSSCGDESVSTLRLHTPGFGAISRKRGMVLPKPEPKIDYPTGPYDYCSPYGETPYSCSVPDCYECLSQNQNALLYSTPPSTYGSSSFYGSTLGRKSSSVYSNTYGNKFGLSKKGLLQIDYSCSWNDLDRVIGRNY